MTAANCPEGIESGVQTKARRIVLYGTGGIGKSTLAASMREVGIMPLFIDLEYGTNDLDVQRKRPPDDGWSWLALRSALLSPDLDQFDGVVIDSGTEAEKLAASHVIDTIPVSKDGDIATSLESYGYGKGYTHLCDAMTLLLADLDRLRNKGKHVVLICHDCKASVPNPAGDDYIRYEPCLYHSKSGNASIRDRVKNWADEVLFIGYDVAAKGGKAKGSGTRQIHCQEQATFIAKSRTLRGPYSYDEGNVQIWKDLFGKE